MTITTALHRRTPRSIADLASCVQPYCFDAAVRLTVPGETSSVSGIAELPPLRMSAG